LQPGMIESFRQWDEEQEKDNASGTEKPATPASEKRKDSRDGPLYEEQLDVFASIQLAELALDGEYIPTQVLSNSALSSGVFLLRQGIQRRIIFKLTHSSGRQFPWQRITRAAFGNVRLVDGKGQTVDEMLHEPVPINLLSQQQVEYHQDGTSTIDAQGAWDSSLHEAAFLNQITATGHQVQLTLSWEVEADKCDKPLQFSTEVFVQIQGRDASNPSKFRTLITPTRTTTKITSVYLVHLRPPLTRNVDDLWRSSTANGYVRGEEYLGNWQPRSISIVREYRLSSNRLQHMNHVAATRQMLYLRGILGDHKSSSRLPTNKSEALRNTSGLIPEPQAQIIKQIISVWKSACVHYSGVCHV
jgi:kinesin family protein 1